MSVLCAILGHRWRVFRAEQCPVDYRSCSRCHAIEHACNSALAQVRHPSGEQSS